MRRRRVHGVDFSGARDAGRRIWVTSAVCADGRLRIDACRPGVELSGSGLDRAACLAALREFVAADARAVFGFDFPFGLPRELVRGHTWESFVSTFGERYPGPEAFRRASLAAGAGRELRRRTDVAARAPFSAYNLRIYRQTYHGVRDLLAPLVAGRRACALPMQRADRARPWLVEVCPASTLKAAGLYRSYKGVTPAHRRQRRRILEALGCLTSIATVPAGIREAIIEDAGGDALDSAIAAVAVGRAVDRLPSLGHPPDATHLLEGVILV